MSSETIASMLNEAIERSGLTEQEVAHRVGFENGNMVNMMRNGVIEIPYESVLSLVAVLQFDEYIFFRRLVLEYGGGKFQVAVDPDQPDDHLVDVALRTLHYIAILGRYDVWPATEKALENLLEVAKKAAYRR